MKANKYVVYTRKENVFMFYARWLLTFIYVFIDLRIA